MRSVKMQKFMDKTAIVLSTACAIHCLLMPVALVMLPTLAATSLGSENFHYLMLGLVIPVSALALIQGCSRHRDQMVLLLGIGGLLLLVAIALIGENILGETGEKIGTISGAAILAFGHFRNYRLCRKNYCQR